MPGRIRQLAGHTGAYGVATMAGGITRVALVPVIARYLDTAEYGRASVVLIMITLLTIVFDLGQSSSLIKFVSGAGDERERKRVISTVLSASLLISLPLAAALAALSGRLSSLLLGSGGYRNLVLAGVAGGLGNALLQVGLSYERALARPVRYVAYTVLKGGLSLALTVTLIVAMNMGSLGLVLGLALPPLAIGALIYAGRALRFSLALSGAVLRRILDFGLPLVPMNLAMWVLAYSDIYLLRRLLPAEHALSEVGLYQYAHEICLVLVLPVTALNLAWPQFLFSNHHTPGAREMFAGVHRYFSFLLIGLAFLLSAFAPHILGIVGSESYLGSFTVIPWLSASLVFYGLSILYSSGLYVAGRTRVLAGAVASSAALNVVLNLLLIPSLGKEGAAMATMATNCVMAFSMISLARWHYAIPFALRPVVLSIPAGAAVIAALRLSAGRGAWPASHAALGAVVFAAAVTVFYRLRPGELRRGAGFMKAVLRRPRA